MHLILFSSSGLHSLIHLKSIQVPLNMMFLITLYRALLFWNKFYYRLFKYKKGRRSIWRIVTKPSGANYRRPVRPSNQITCLNAGYYFHSFYQLKVAYACLRQQSDKDIENVVSDATSIVFYDDPLPSQFQIFSFWGYYLSHLLVHLNQCSHLHLYYLHICIQK